jgi:non-heme chloroperoxidase
LLTRSLASKAFSIAVVANLGVSLAEAQVSGARSGFVTTPDGVKVHYLEKGSGDAILFVPGWTMPAEVWEPQIEEFSKTHRVVAMDPRSQGRSDKPNDGHHPAARARDIKAVVDELRLAPVVMVGWSMAVSELAAYTEQFGTGGVARYVLVDGIAGGDYDPQMTPMMLRFAATLDHDRPKATAAFVRSMFSTPKSEQYLSRLAEASMLTPTNSAIALFVGDFASDNRGALAKIDKPTLVVVAAGSPWMPLFEDLHKRIAGSQFEIMENAGHALFVDQPARFNDLLRKFLGSHPQK